MKKNLILMLMALLTLPAFARDFEYTYEAQTLTYTVIDEDAKTVMTKSGDRNSDTAGNEIFGKLMIPSQVSDGEVEYNVTEIGESAFYHCSSLTTVYYPADKLIEGDYYTFAKNAYERATLYLSKKGMETYLNVELWNKFRILITNIL